MSKRESKRVRQPGIDRSDREVASDFRPGRLGAHFDPKSVPKIGPADAGGFLRYGSPE
jgi:hypothetical protein